MKKPALCLILLLVLGGVSFAQFDTASVLGTVRDSTGALVPAATVTLINLYTGIAVTRNSDDTFALAMLTEAKLSS